MVNRSGRIKGGQVVLAAALVWAFGAMVAGAAAAEEAAEPVTINDDGGWSWFEDERAIVVEGEVVVGSVAAGVHDPQRTGNVEVATYDPATGETHRSVLHERLQRDDHNSPALLQRADGQILAMYSKHGPENRIYYRLSEEPNEATDWGPVQVFVPSESSRITYSNLFQLSEEDGRIYNFYRGYDDTFKPSWMTSDDGGETWNAHGLWIDLPSDQRHRPYVKYTSDNREMIHFIFTEGHPRVYDNSIYHAFYRDGKFHRSDGEVIKEAARGPVTPDEATRIFAGDERNVAWTSDIHLDERGRPVVAYSVQKDPERLEYGDPESGQDHRYRYARWDGERWIDHEIAYAGTRLYPGEDDYTGNICIAPDHPDTVFISADVDPRTGEPLPGGHYEIFRGVTEGGGERWTWTPITEDSDEDNLRPIVPIWNEENLVVLWLRGTYDTYQDYDLDVVGLVLDPR